MRKLLAVLAILPLFAIAACEEGTDLYDKIDKRINGKWSGEIYSKVLHIKGKMTGRIWQKEKDLSGRITIDIGEPGYFSCVDNAKFIGKISGLGFYGALYGDNGTEATMRGHLVGDDQIQGNYRVTKGQCAGDNGVFAVQPKNMKR